MGNVYINAGWCGLALACLVWIGFSVKRIMESVERQEKRNAS